MPPETESERVTRIQDAQRNARQSGSTKRRQQITSTPGKATKSKAKAKPQKKPVTSDRQNTSMNAVKDILVGVTIAAIPAILAIVFLPGGFKLLSVVVLLIGGVAGYMFGETLA